ncbi:Imm50 family immunity protein [Pseudomonas sp. GD03944]|uniref:Imm50 family immunity protein n=1 Tax=Pseudomonas sp. GD03944 TaxID=2975409 RepID=UPI002449BF10|nr:Imm50 family immunity protein [Pseudomonas sp. GD03944]MDH1262928.1 immunity 50 family protein [Pseudomonas sp. GD03944]
MDVWTEILVDATALRAVYGQDTPSLEGINLHSIEIERDGPSVLLRFDLRDFPKKPPKKWTISAFNRVQLSLLAVGVSELQINGLRSDCMINLEITKENGIIHIRSYHGAIKIDIKAEHLLLGSISSYCEAPSV